MNSKNRIHEKRYSDGKSGTWWGALASCRLLLGGSGTGLGSSSSSGGGSLLY
jgi:hypothetical protein